MLPLHDLVLHPVDPDFAVEDATGFLRQLRALGLAGEAFAPGRYLVGGEFLRLIAFLGCSPAIGLSPEEGSQFCHLLLPPPLSRPALFFGTNRKAPRCGACRKIATESPPAAGAVVCGNCGAEQALADLDWRRSACVARSVLIVRGIYESEAMPAEVLLQKLEELTGAAWDYCYIRDPVGMSS